MAEAADALDFEQAQVYKDKLRRPGEALRQEHHHAGGRYGPGCRCLLPGLRRRRGLRQLPAHPRRRHHPVAEPRLQDEHRGGSRGGAERVHRRDRSKFGALSKEVIVPFLPDVELPGVEFKHPPARRQTGPAGAERQERQGVPLQQHQAAGAHRSRRIPPQRAGGAPQGPGHEGAARAHGVLRQLQHPGHQSGGLLRGVPQRGALQEGLPQIQDQDGGRRQRLRLHEGGGEPPLFPHAGRGAGRPPAAGGHRRRQGPAGVRLPGPLRTGHPGPADGRGPGEAPGGSDPGGRSVSAVHRPEFPGPEGAAAHPRRGAPLRHHLPPQPAQQGGHPERPAGNQGRGRADGAAPADALRLRGPHCRGPPRRALRPGGLLLTNEERN